MIRSRLSLKTLLVALISLRMGVIAISAFLPLSFPDVWRQVINLSVSMRYYSRWFLEKGAHHLLFPAVLDSGDTQGIMPMELPILNLLTAPCFALGPHLGRAFAILVYNCIMIFLVLINAKVWKGKKILGIEPYLAMLILPICSIGLQWSGKYMTDFLSVLLVCIAVGLAWDKERPIGSFIFSTLGLLMKPPAVILFLLFLGHEGRLRKIINSTLWGIPSVVVTYLYFTKGIEFLSHYQEIPSAVYVNLRSFSIGFFEFFKNIPFVAKFYVEKSFFLGGIFLVLGITLYDQIVKKIRFKWELWLISFCQFLLLSIIDGGNFFYDHFYYLLSLVPVFALLYIDCLNRLKKPSILFFILIIGLVVPMIEISLRDLKPLYRKPKEPIWSIDQQVKALQTRNPEFGWRMGKAYRASSEPFPFLGLYFGEIQGSKNSHFGFFYADEPIPSECNKVDHTELLVLCKF